jgi:hypothetical protein
LKLLAQLAQTPGNAFLDRAFAVSKHPCDFAECQIGAKPKRDGLALVVPELGQGRSELITIFNSAQRSIIVLTSIVDANSFKRSILDTVAPSMVACQVQGDRVNPVLLASSACIESRAGAQNALKGVRDQILGQLSVARAIYEEREQRFSVVLKKPFKAGITQPIHHGRF